jgi:hypothetical protein
MADTDKTRQAMVAHLAAVIERAAADLALAEEPARFVTALETEADDDAAGAREHGR